MLTVLYCVGIIAGLLRKRDIFVKIYQFVVVWILFAFNTQNADMDNYRAGFSLFNIREPGFDSWKRLFSGNNVSFEAFWICTYTIVLIVIYVSLRRIFGEIDNAAISLLMIFPFPRWVITLRNTIAIAIVLWAISWYILNDSNKLYNKAIYALMILISGSFHYSTLFFLIILLVNDDRPSIKSIIRTTEIAIISVVLLNSSLFMTALKSLITSQRIISWFDSANRIGMGFFLVILLHSIEFFIVVFSYRCRNNGVGCTGGESYLIENKIYSINVYSIFLIGFYTFNMEFFSRIYCAVIVLNCLNSFHLLKEYKRNEYALVGSVMQIVYIVGLFCFYFAGEKFGVVSELFLNNSLFQ